MNWKACRQNYCYCFRDELPRLKVGRRRPTHLRRPDERNERIRLLGAVVVFHCMLE